MVTPAPPARTGFSAFIRRPLGITLAIFTGVLALCCVAGIIGAVLTGSKPSPTSSPSAPGQQPPSPTSIPAPTTQPQTAPATTASAPAPTQPAPAPAPTQPAPEPEPSGGNNYPIVHPGAFCSTAGALGVTTDGTLMVCKTTATDSRLRWRSA